MIASSTIRNGLTDWFLTALDCVSSVHTDAAHCFLTWTWLCHCFHCSEASCNSDHFILRDGADTPSCATASTTISCSALPPSSSPRASIARLARPVLLPACCGGTFQVLPQNIAHATIPAKGVTAESSRPWWKWVCPQTDRATTGCTCSFNTQRAPDPCSPLDAWEQPALCPSDRKTALEMRALDLVDEADFGLLSEGMLTM